MLLTREEEERPSSSRRDSCAFARSASLKMDSLESSMDISEDGSEIQSNTFRAHVMLVLIGSISYRICPLIELDKASRVMLSF